MDPSYFEAWIDFLKNGQNDFERFGTVLWLATKLATGELSVNQKLELFETIGFTPNALYELTTITREPPEGHPQYVYKAFGLNMIEMFCKDKDITEDHLAETIDVFKKIISQPNEGIKHVVFNLARSIKLLVENPRAEQDFNESLLCGYLVEQFVQVDNRFALKLLMMLGTLTGRPFTPPDLNSFLAAMEKLATDFYNEPTQHIKIEIALLLLQFFNTDFDVLPDTYSSPLPEWTFYIREGIREMLQEKLEKGEKNVIFELLLQSLKYFRNYWLLEFHEAGRESENTFVCLLGRTALLEIYTYLKSGDLKEVVQDSTTLLVCISVLCDILYVLNMIDIPELVNMMRQTFSTFVKFLFMLSDRWNSLEREQKSGALRALAITCFNNVGSWVDFKKLGLTKKTDLIQVIPFLLVFTGDCLQILKEEDEFHPVAHGHDVPQVLIPLINRVISDNDCRKFFLEEGGHQLFYVCLVEYVWKFFPGDKDVPTADRDDAELWVEIICDPLVEILAIEKEGITKFGIASEIFPNFAKFFFDALPQIPTGKYFIRMRALFCAIALEICKHYDRTTLDCLEPEKFLPFLSWVIHFLRDSQVLIKSDKSVFVFSGEFQNSVWKDVTILWYSIMEVLIEHFLPLLQEKMAVFLFESDYPNHIISCMAQVENVGIQPGVKAAFEDLLCAIVQYHPEALKAFRGQGAKAVTVAHGLKKFKALLKSKKQRGKK